MHFHSKDMILIYYVDNLLNFAGKESQHDELEVKLNTKLVTKDPGIPKRLVGTRLI